MNVKNPPPAFANLKRIRIALFRTQQEKRKEARRQNFQENRRIVPDFKILQNEEEVENRTFTITEHRQKLIEWQKKRKEKKAEEALKKRPIFKAGIYHHRVYSPSVDSAFLNAIKRKQAVEKKPRTAVIKKKVTNSSEKCLLPKAKMVARNFKNLQANMNYRKQYKPIHNIRKKLVFSP